MARSYAAHSGRSDASSTRASSGSGVAAPYDAPMDSSPVVTPPYVASPLRLRPFRGLMLAPGRIGDPASARAFARPYKDVAARLTQLGGARAGAPRRRTGGLPARVHRPAGSPCAASSARSTSRTGPPRRGARGPPARGHPPGAGRRAGRADGRDADEPGADPARPARARRPDATSSTRCWTPRRRTSTPTGPGSSTGCGRSPTPSDLAALDNALAGTRALIADGHHRYAAYLQLQHRHPGGPHDRGLAMLVDQDETPLFLGAIHRVLVGPQPRRPARRRGGDRREVRSCAPRSRRSPRWARTRWSPPTAPSGSRSALELGPDRAAVQGCTSSWCPRCRGRRSGSATTTRVEDAHDARPAQLTAWPC